MTQSFNFADLLSKAGDVSNDLIPESEYTVTVVEAEALIAGSGNPMIKVQFSVVGGPHAGRVIFNNFVLAINSDKGDVALKPFFRQMGLFGLDAEFFKTVTSLDQVAPLLVGKQVNVKTINKEYNGTVYTNVKSVSAAKSAAGVAPSIGIPVPAATGIPTPQVPATPTPPAAPPAPPAAPQVTPPAPATAPPPPPF